MRTTVTPQAGETVHFEIDRYKCLMIRKRVRESVRKTGEQGVYQTDKRAQAKTRSETAYLTCQYDQGCTQVTAQLPLPYNSAFLIQRPSSEVLPLGLSLALARGILSSERRVLQPTPRRIIMNCSRSRGLMIEDQFLDLEGAFGEMWATSLRCVNCGCVQDADRRAHV